MGYELSIQRTEESNKITVTEWASYIQFDPTFEAIEECSADLGNGKILTMATPNAGLWKSEKGEVPFTFDEELGWITVKNPDHWIIEKMIEIANELNAIVLGEEEEIYDEAYLRNPNKKPRSIHDTDEKKWWQFWK